MTISTEGVNPWRALGPTAEGAPKQAQKSQAQMDGALRASEVGLSNDGADADGKEFQAFGDDGFTFYDFLDIINPLQHIPVVSTVYRNMSEDQLDPAPRIMGSTLFMGPIGLATSTLNVVVEHQTGQDLGQHVVSMFEDDSTPLGDIKTADKESNAPVAAAGTHAALDPVTAWAQTQTTYYNEARRSGGQVAQGNAVTGDVTSWARAQNAYYNEGMSSQATAAAANGTAPLAAADTGMTASQKPMDVDTWAREQVAYYGQGASTTQVAASQPRQHPQSMDIDAWARDQVAFYTAGQTEIAAGQPHTPPMDVDSWAQEQVAFYNGGKSPTELAGVQSQATPSRSSSDTLDVDAWAREQTAFYNKGNTQIAAVDAQKPAAPDTDVTAWAARETAMANGGRREQAPIQTQTRDTLNGVIAQGGGWFTSVMKENLALYEAAQRRMEVAERN